MCTRTQGKGIASPQENEPDLPASAGGSPVEVWARSGSPQGKGHCQQKIKDVPIVQSSLDNAIYPTIQSVDSRTGAPHAKKLTGREHSPSQLQTSELTFYWAQICPPEQDPVFPTTSPCYQEACTSLLDSLIHQMADRRSKKNYNPKASKTKPSITENQN